MLDGYKASEWLKNQRKKNRMVIFTEKKLRFVSVEEVEQAAITNSEEKLNRFVAKIESIA